MAEEVECISLVKGKQSRVGSHPSFSLVLKVSSSLMLNTYVSL